MNTDTELLTYVCRGAQKGLDKIRRFSGVVHASDSVRALADQYESIHFQAQSLIKETEQTETEPGFSNSVSGGENAAAYPTVYTADMLIQESLIDIIETAKCIRKCREAGSRSLALAEKLLHAEEEFANSVKLYLQW